MNLATLASPFKSPIVRIQASGGWSLLFKRSLMDGEPVLKKLDVFGRDFIY